MHEIGKTTKILVKQNVFLVVSVIMAPQVGPDPQMITCPSCRSSVITRIEYEPTTKTHIIAGLLCVFW